MNQSRIETFKAGSDKDRLDKVIAARIPDLSRSAAQRLIDAGQVEVDGEVRRASYILHAGEMVTVRIPPPVPAEVCPEALPLDILYEDGDILVVDKAAGMVVHPGAGNPSGTLVNAVLAHCPDLEGVGGVLRPGIVHRLDKDTSGVIIIAKNDAAHKHLQRQFKRRTVHKTYIALLTGRLIQSDGIIEAPIGRHKVHRKRMAVTTSGRPARTGWVVITRYVDVRGQPYTLVNVNLLTGRTHQIRVHFAWLGYPLVGDTVYGPKRAVLSAPRQFLHASCLCIKHPRTEEDMSFSAPLPQDLSLILQQLTAEDAVS